MTFSRRYLDSKRPQQEQKPERPRLDLSHKKALVIDFGLFTEPAIRLARDFAEVKYFCQWQDAFPETEKAKTGTGLDGLERVEYWADHVDDVDCIFIPDTHCHDITEFLKRQGYPVAGAGYAEKLELDRAYGRKVQRDAGLPAQQTWQVKGVTNLRAFLKEHKELYIKINTYRGLSESFKHYDYKSSESRIDFIEYKAGPFKEEVVFIVEEIIKGIEPGYDCVTYGGEMLYPLTAGYEIKGAGYLCRTVFDESEMPKSLKEVHDGMAPIFEEHQTRFFYSTEVRVPEKDKAYLIDPTMRLAAPGPNAIQTELFENYSEVVYGLANGIRVEPIIKHKYSAACCFTSEEARTNWLNVSFPKELRQWVKFRMAVKKGDDYYAVPGFDSICSVVGMGDTMDEAIQQVKDRSEEVNATGLDKNTSGLDEMKEKFAEGAKLGIEL